MATLFRRKSRLSSICANFVFNQACNLFLNSGELIQLSLKVFGHCKEKMDILLREPNSPGTRTRPACQCLSHGYFFQEIPEKYLRYLFPWIHRPNTKLTWLISGCLWLVWCEWRSCKQNCQCVIEEHVYRLEPRPLPLGGRTKKTVGPVF